MKNTWVMAVAALLVLSTAACKKANRGEQLAALDSAYQSGVLSKSEYDAKKLALMGPAPAPPTATAPPAPAPPDAAAPSVTPAPPPNAPSKTPPVPVRARAVPKAPVPPPAVPPARPPVAATAAQPQPIAQPPATPDRPAAETELGPLAGCEGAEYQSGDVKGARRRFYVAPIDAVKRAAATALSSLDFDIHKNAGNEIEASKRKHISAIVGAGGERLLLHFEKSQQGSLAGTLVIAETRKSFVGRVSQKSWTNAVLTQIACHLRAPR